MKVPLLFILLLFSLSAAAQKKPVMREGIEGKIYLKQGNSMPVPGRKISNGAPVSRKIYVYQLTTTAQTVQQATFFTNVKTKLIAKAESDADGYYFVAVPAGNYSVFVEERDKLYANIFDGSGNICPVKVKADSVSRKDIVIDSRAVN